MPILCEPASSARELIHSIDGDVYVADTLGGAAKLLDNDPNETLVVIGPRVGIGDALAFSAALRLARPAVGVILACRDVDVTTLTRALQSGVREVVPAGDHGALAAACRRSYEVSRRMLAPPAEDESAPGQIVTVFAAKGGCGKTTLAVNLGVALARHAVRVCVLDLDLAFGDVAISVQLDPVRTMVDALPMAGHLDITGAASLLTRYQPGLDMLLAPVTPGDAEKIPPRLVGELLAVLRTMFDFIVVDFPDPTSYSLGKLYTTAFYRAAARHLSAQGAMVVQSTSPMFARDSFWCIVQTLKEAGLQTRPYHAYVPSFGEWGFVLASHGDHGAPQSFPAGLRFVSVAGLPAMFDFPPDMAPVPMPANHLNDQVLVRAYDRDWKDITH